MFDRKIHYKWSFSMAMLVYQRVTPQKKKDSPYKVFGKEYRGAKMLKLTMARKASCNENPREWSPPIKC